MIKYYFIILVSFSVFQSCITQKQFFIPKTNDQLKVDSEEGKISIITYNIQTVMGKGDDEIDGLIDYLNKAKFDIITLQEVFDEKTRNELITKLNPSIYKAIIPRIDYDYFPSNINQDAGLFTASTFSQINLNSYEFDNDVEISYGAVHKMLKKVFSPSMDFLANKSVAGSLHQINDSTKLFMVTTHLQAISSKFHRTYQLEQIYSFIAKSVAAIVKNNLVNSSQNLIVLLTGDLNYNAYDEEDIRTLKEYLGNPRDLHQEFNKEKEEYTMMSKLFGFHVRFDYIFAYDNIGLISLRKVKATSINVTDVIDTTNSSVSDHLAIKAILDIKPNR